VRKAIAGYAGWPYNFTRFANFENQNPGRGLMAEKYGSLLAPNVTVTVLGLGRDGGAGNIVYVE
jgi:hypothetical protein